ncbi:MAG TPA: hypothetical protein VLJ59_13760 [Mycobacteriales bacterium]|nr:hypothetical protein [Mycobacteriales bacterium]
MSRSSPDIVPAEWRRTQQDLLAEVVSEDFHQDSSGLRFLRLDPADVLSPVRVPVAWSPVPRQLVDCLGRDGARQLCDWAPGEANDQRPQLFLRGGREHHIEYCEYAIVLDERGRPKRVEITTELREWWMCLAQHAPERLRAEAARTLRRNVDEMSYQDLYGALDPVQVTDPKLRGEAFQAEVAGSEVGNPRVAPQGRLNRDHTLFMSVPINGLDDLYFIMLLAARRFARSAGGRLVAAPLPWLFLDNPYYRDHPEDQADIRRLYCTHADPAVARAVQRACWSNRTVAVDPLAVVMRRADFAADRLVFPRGVRGRWVRWSRPAADGMFQRLVVGPGDDEPETLGDIGVRDPAGDVERLTGGYQLLELLSVGVVLAVSPPGTTDAEPELVHPESQLISCNRAGCRECVKLAAALDRSRQPAPGGAQPRSASPSPRTRRRSTP